jgi:hypothetical protein
VRARVAPRAPLRQLRDARCRRRARAQRRSGARAARLTLHRCAPANRLNKDDRMLELPEDPSIGAAFQRHKLRECAPVLRSRAAGSRAASTHEALLTRLCGLARARAQLL